MTHEMRRIEDVKASPGRTRRFIPTSSPAAHARVWQVGVLPGLCLQLACRLRIADVQSIVGLLAALEIANDFEHVPTFLMEDGITWNDGGLTGNG